MLSIYSNKSIDASVSSGKSQGRRSTILLNCLMGSITHYISAVLYILFVLLNIVLLFRTTIMILNYHHRMADTHNMPEWVSISLTGVFIYLVNKQTSQTLSTWSHPPALTPFSCRSVLSSSSGCPGSSRWAGQGRRSPGRPSWWPRRWRSLTSRRPPPSRCSPMFWIWTMISEDPPYLE